MSVKLSRPAEYRSIVGRTDGRGSVFCENSHRLATKATGEAHVLLVVLLEGIAKNGLRTVGWTGMGPATLCSCSRIGLLDNQEGGKWRGRGTGPG